ncbi:sigma-70 family RNA polymerase sigma factor [Nocardiopsis alborubida]|uniref:Sigma-70 family RNA polymerase sigma factor n=1 Tax=Nocardiopsis alborubida TaxID=146802 RepID=A0A7X6MF59_9ACTN|nr:sigma-70 family RNA polymerase sigma factor [Nocardiopsis alborubida]NKY99677.1 sigma-70 family RNA polymerase sigma factor [Nocardiopsis alborubida]
MNDVPDDHTETLVGDGELIQWVRGGDTGAYATLYERHAAAARGLARQLLRGEAEVEDAVAEAFTRVLSVIRRGGGPRDSFRPYLLTAVRNAAYDRGRGERRQVVTDDMESLDPGQPFVDPALEGLERSLIARAFLSLPERWQSVLWHTEIEGAKPAEVADVLGMKPNSVAALAYRAREGLRQAYLQMHLAGGNAAEACRPTLGLLGAHVREGLSRRDTAKVDRHMDGCADCREVYAELADVNVGLRGVVLPLVAGAGAAGYLSAGTAGSAWWGRMSRRQQQAAAASTAAAGVAVAVALALAGAPEPLPGEGPPPVAAPWEQPQTPPAPDAPRPDPDAPQPAPSANDRPSPDADERPEPAAPVAAVPPADVPEEEVAPQEPQPRFAVGIDPVGSLLPGSDGIMVMDVRNIGGAAEEVVALLTLPPGVEMVSSGGAGNAVPTAVGHGDWSCSAGSGGGRCAHPGMAAGEDGTQFIDVRVAPDAEVGVPAAVSVSSAGVTAEATGERGVSAEGVTARYATAGRVRAESVGNALMTCVEPERGDRWPWPWWDWPYDPDVPDPRPPGPGTAPGTESSPAPEVPASPSPGPPDSEATTEEGGEEGVVPGQQEGEGAPDGTAGGPDNNVPTETVRDPSSAGAAGRSVPVPVTATHGDPGPRGTPETQEQPQDGPCAQARLRQGPRLDNDHWTMAPLDADDDPSTTSSSSATWELPEGSRVRWAGLYLSGTGTPDAPSVRVRGPGMTDYRTVAATDSRVAELPGYPAYQAFAEVTDLVRAQGGGQWWVGDAPVREGRGHYAGWSLVVVLEDPRVGTRNQVMVLDDSRVSFHGGGDGPFAVSGLLPAAVPARIDVVAWEGDPDLGGDRVSVDGTAVAPVGGHGRVDNAFTGSARGAVGDPLAFGTDVVRFDSVLGRETDIRILTEQDAVMVGAVVLTAPMRS